MKMTEFKMKTINEDFHIASLPNRREYSNHELVRGMIAKDPHVGSAFFEAYGEKINQMVWTLLRSEDDHQDVVHAALVTIMKSIKSIKDPDRLPQWISTITINTVRGEIRKRQVRRRFTEEVDDAEERLVFNQTHPEDIAGRIFATVRTMKPDHQIIFTLHYIEGYSYTEIAELQGRSLSTAKRKGRRSKAEFLKKAARDLVLASFAEDVI